MFRTPLEISTIKRAIEQLMLFLAPIIRYTYHTRCHRNYYLLSSPNKDVVTNDMTTSEQNLFIDESFS